MNRKRPIIALTGSSGAGKTNIKSIFNEIFFENGIKAINIQGDGFHKYTRTKMAELDKTGSRLTHFASECNHLDLLENLFKQFSTTGKGMTRRYAHSESEAKKIGAQIGFFSEWEEFEPNYDILLYEGLHGGFKDDKINISKYVDLLIGITPSINLEWVQKCHRYLVIRGYSKNEVKKLIIKRLPDYLEYICPQFSRTDANLERIPLVDLADPFKTKSIPADKNSIYMLSIKDNSIIEGLRTCLEKFDLFTADSDDMTITVRAKELKSLFELIFLPKILNLIGRK